MDVAGSVVLLTGGSTGIGREIARIFMKKSATVIVFGIHKPPYCSRFHNVDVSEESQIVSALAQIGQIDILINNGGVACDGTIEETSNTMLDRMIGVNLKGVFWMMKHSLPKLNGGGCIISINSTCGIRGLPGLAVYSATKAAALRLTESLAQEVASRRIRVNSIASGLVETELWEKRFGDRHKDVLHTLEMTTLLQRSARPEEIAHAALFLCENEFIDGETLTIDGGQTIYAR